MSLGAGATMLLVTLTLQAVPASNGCVTFQSPPRLLEGKPFVAPLAGGLEFRLSPDGVHQWSIRVGPRERPEVDWLWVVSPPLQTAPHRIIGPAYGLSARQSAKIDRPLRFVTSDADYAAALRAVDLKDAAETLRRLDELGRGRLTITLTDFHVRDVVEADGRHTDAFDWIAFTGEACVAQPRRTP